MKISYGSDLHLEFGINEIETSNSEKADLLILAGDIITPWIMRKEQIDLLVNLGNAYPRILMLMGNHEHYHGCYWQTLSAIEELTKDIVNLRLFNNNTEVIDGIRFVGSTMWTDFNRGDPVAQWDAQHTMNDYRLIKGDNDRPITPGIVLEAHTHAREYIEKAVENSEEPVVVFTHHAPSFLSINGRYARSKINSAYASNLDEFIMDNPIIKFWVHGHIHNPVDYTIGDTRVVSNPRGYYGHEVMGKYKFNSVVI